MTVSIMNASKNIKGSKILENITLEFNSGKVYGLEGPNGSGKTMLLRLIAGLIRPTEGEVLVDGKRLGKDLDFPENMGLLIETPAFLPEHTGYKNLQFLADIQKKITSADMEAALMEVGLGPQDVRPFRKYSLGMKQRLGIAAAIMEKPELLLLDEPTNSLDKAGVEEITQLILRQKSRGALLVVASHDREFLQAVSDEVYTVCEGHVQRKEST